MSVILVNAHSMQIPLPDESVHCVVTSPPYWGLRDYGLPPLVWGGDPGCRHMWGKERIITNSAPRDHDGPNTFADTRGQEKQRAGTTLKASQGQFCRHCHAWRGCLGLEPDIDLYVSHLVQVFREVRRVLHPTGTVWLNMGDSYATNPGNGRGGERVDGGKPHRSATNKANAGLKPKDLCMIPARVALSLQADGWWLRSQIIWHKPNCMPESVTDRTTTSHEYVFLLAKSERYFYDIEAVREALAESTLDDDRLYDPDYTIDRPNRDYAGDPRRPDRGNGMLKPPTTGRNRRTVWTIPTSPYAGAHFATFPPALVEPMIKAGASERGVCPHCLAPWEQVIKKPDMGDRPKRSYNAKMMAIDSVWSGANSAGQKYQEWRNANPDIIIGWRPTCDCPEHDPIPATVLDPFVGSGTTLLVARALGRHGIGLDLSYDYLHDQARARLELDDWDAWHGGGNGTEAGSLEGLPLFEGIR